MALGPLQAYARADSWAWIVAARASEVVLMGGGCGGYKAARASARP